MAANDLYLSSLQESDCEGIPSAYLRLYVGHYLWSKDRRSSKRTSPDLLSELWQSPVVDERSDLIWLEE